MEGSAHGRFVWYDLMTSDPGAAKGFHTAVTGRGLELWEQAAEGMPPYTMFTVDGEPIGGVAELPAEAVEQGATPHWLAYVQVDDVDATLERAKELGANVLAEPQDIPTVGRFSVIQDPQGAVIAIFRSVGDPPGHDGDPRHGDFSWHELATSDHEAAWGFYSDLFGWTRTNSFDMGDGGMYEMFSSGGREDGAMFRKPAEMPGPPAWIYYTLVADLDEALETVTSSGGRILMGPMEVPDGDRVAQCMDPQGAVFALHEKGGG